MTKNKYESPRLEIIDDFQVDIITTSCSPHRGCPTVCKSESELMDDDFLI